MKKILITVLMLLQLVAPLVHAHASGDLSGIGLHVPGLELYSATQELPEIQALARTAASEYLIIDIDSGMHYEAANFSADDLRNSVCLLFQDGFLNHQVLLRHQINFSPHRQHLMPLAFVLSPLAPRAPPALN